MSDTHPIENGFLNKLTLIIEENISNDQFGVSELADTIGMSRSNLLRKVKKLSGLSVSQFIRQVRLKNAMEILLEDSFNVSEVSYKVGFSSTSYFIKCFREYYGFPPGEAGKRNIDIDIEDETKQHTQSHQLAAIMFTDIQGYTSLMQRDEKKAVEFRDRHRELFNAVTNKFKGKILQYFGDGTLSTFPSAIDAVRCGIEMQQAFREEPNIPVRIGIHTGDIIFTEDDIIGDGVNVASRVESLASAGSVFISDKVYDEVKNQSGIQTVSMGIFELKNVDKPIEVFAVSNPGLLVPVKDHITKKLKNESAGGISGVRAKKQSYGLKWIILFLIVIIGGFLIYNSDLLERTSQLISSEYTTTKKSIAVLPFINDSNDSTNLYIINGLMESLLTNLQKINDLRVVSRTSVEKYRNKPQSIPEVARELNVKYVVEGSGQKLGDKILLHIQLIDAQNDKHLWARQYSRESKDIFALQREISKDIAAEIEAIITPEEAIRIEKSPTDNLIAYDYFLQGLDLFYQGTLEGLEESIIYFEKAIDHDEEFARAYADIGIAYYFLDAVKSEKIYSEQINYYADQALLFDPQLPMSLIAKALFYIQSGEYDLAIPYLEKALEYNPNSALAINTLSDFYTRYIPNTGKYLEYALKGIGLDIAANDSITASFIYLHLSNAFVQSGFIHEAEMYIDRSLNYDPENLYSAYVKAYILYAKNRNLQQLSEKLIQTFKRDTTRLDILQEIGKSYYYQRDFPNAFKYYKPFLDIKEKYGLEMFESENAKIGLVMAEMGFTQESEKLFLAYKTMAENDNSIYKHLSLAAYFSYTGDAKRSLEHLKLFSKQDNYFYWILIFSEIDPLFDNINDRPEFKKILYSIETKFWEEHQQIKASLEEKGLI